MIEYAVGIPGQTLVITDTAIAHLSRHRQLEPEWREAGGQLFARIECDQIRIVRATGPRASDIRQRRAYIPNRTAERLEIQRLFNDGLHYVGDWHTHGEHCPHPSATDIASMRDMYRRSRHRLASFVMVIVGTGGIPETLFVGIVNSVGCQELSPAIAALH